MPVTRSASRQASEAATTTNSSTRKRLAKDEPKLEQEAKPSPQVKRRKNGKQVAKAVVTPSVEDASSLPANIPITAPEPPTEEQELLPAILSFSFDEAKKHLIKVDPRFEDLFAKLKCRPFEHLERVDPFRWDRAFKYGYDPDELYLERLRRRYCKFHLGLCIRNLWIMLWLRGQQISWLAARAITHKFIRLFDPSLPEKPDHGLVISNLILRMT